MKSLVKVGREFEEQVSVPAGKSLSDLIVFFDEKLDLEQVGIV